MAVEKRYLLAQIRADLSRKMVFVAGPRQVGKTTLAFTIPGARKAYLNWDVAAGRERILRQELPPGKLWIFDELHKYRRWRNYLKGIYDGRPARQHILVTGSGRLDLYRFGGDSLQGRYHLLHLHPFSVAEQRIRDRDGFEQLLGLGGFPEPFLGGSEEQARRWSREYRTRLIREDVVSLERIQDLGHLELLMMRLPELVGSPLSINALREDLQVSHKAVASWIAALERLYAVFRLAPFGAPRIRAVRKEQKHYHFDWSIVPDDAARFENLVASHLLKWVHFEQDARGKDVELHYFRDVDGREVDFVVTDRKKPLLLVECKWADTPVDKGLRYLKAKFPGAAAWQISATGRKDYQSAEGIRVAHALELLETLI
ncbi:MAG TPA: ATP-binding protein [Thermoanaerobaculia bacterium]|nr:ATP-binding protein [Thermoanaerobaculia bacterium]